MTNEDDPTPHAGDFRDKDGQIDWAAFRAALMEWTARKADEPGATDPAV